MKNSNSTNWNSAGEQAFAEKMGLVQNTERMDSSWKDTDENGKGGHGVVPDHVVIDWDGNYCLIEYKHGNKLNTDGARGGKQAAEKKKADYLASSWGNAKQRAAYAAATMGWNHSVYKMIGMKSHYDRVVVVDPKLDKHAIDTDYQRKVLNKGKANGVEFMTVTEFETAFEGCLDVSVEYVDNGEYEET
ncbi:hypothetical protein [Vibrio maerlii]|uniref:hypothetical protein n=1 Tax=Vibrio maerlii TaxID=2231648 RepID=UPI000E3D9CFA|nr:hypothetical protein [Vibrio maerlii]